jgi:hypothetical protein
LEEKRGLTRRPKDAKEDGISTTEDAEGAEEEGDFEFSTTDEH